MQKNQEFLGKVELLSAGEVTASCPTTIAIRYTAGEYGVDENGSIRLAWRTVSDWEQPQFQNPQDFGYTTVKTSAKAKLEVSRSAYQRPFHNCIQIRIRDGNVYPGDTIDIIMGDTSMGSPGIRAQSFVESGHEYKLMVDPFNIGMFQELPESVRVRVKNGPANEIQMVVPSDIVCGEPFAYTLRVLDEWGNPCADFAGKVSVTGPSGSKVVTDVTMSPENKGAVKIDGNYVDKEGEYFFQAVCGDLSCTSNPCCCSAEKQEYKLFWGDMHGQTDFTVGTGSLDEYYSFAKGPGALDFTGWQGNDFEIDHEKWDQVRAKTKEYNKEGEFLVYLGYEWSGNYPGGGDHNVWFLDDEDHFYPSSHWSVDGKFAEDDRWDRYPATKLFEAYRGRKDVMIIPHIGGRPANLDYYDTEFTRNIEIHSHHGTFEWFAHDAMKRNLKVGFVASSDDHTCRPGLSYALQNTGQEGNAFDVKSGLVGVYAKELTKEAIWEALQARRCYAVTFNRMILDVRADGAVMGEETTVKGLPTIQAEVIGETPIDHIDIYRGNDLVFQKYNYTEKKASAKKQVKILWSGVRSIGRKKLTTWNGHLFLDKGKITDVQEVAFDTFQHGVKYRSNQRVSWSSTTSGDYDGLILELDCPDDAVLQFCSPQKNFTIAVSELSVIPTVYPAGGINLKVEASLVGEHPEAVGGNPNKMVVSWTETDESVKQGSYWVKAVQENGQMAFSSPIFINIEK